MRGGFTEFTMQVKKTGLTIVGLIFLQFVIDVLFVVVYPTVSPVRATGIGVTAFLVLGVIWVFSDVVDPVLGALSIFSSALLGALLVQAGFLVSKSPLSGVVHGLILIGTYLLLEWLSQRYWIK